MSNVNEIEGMNDAYAGKLAAVGISTKEDLLKRGATSEGRKAIAQRTGIDETAILHWIEQLTIDMIRSDLPEEEIS
jgi:hypothetical protein